MNDQFYKSFALSALQKFHESLRMMEDEKLPNDFLDELLAIEKVLFQIFVKNGVESSVSSVYGRDSEPKPVLEVKPSNLLNDVENIKPDNCMKKVFVAQEGKSNVDQTTCFKPCDNLGHELLFETVQKVIFRDIEGSDDSDCEMKVDAKRSVDLFKTDYPEECFMSEPTVALEENSISEDTDQPIKESPFKKLREDENNDVLEIDPFIVKITDDVFVCEVCNVTNLPKNNVKQHIHGRQHRTLRSKVESASGSTIQAHSLLKSFKTDTDLSPKNELENCLRKFDERFYKSKDGSLLIVSSSGGFECSLCCSKMTGNESVIQHIQGVRHMKKVQPQFGVNS